MRFLPVVALVGMALVTLGCVTTTTHRLSIADNPRQAEATACEEGCRRTHLEVSQPDRGNYARCLDACPGARVTDGEDCSSPTPGVICETTHKANAGGIAGELLAGAVGVVGIVLLAGIIVLFNAVTP